MAGAWRPLITLICLLHTVAGARPAQSQHERQVAYPAGLRTCCRSSPSRSRPQGFWLQSFLPLRKPVILAGTQVLVEAAEELDGMLQRELELPLDCSEPPQLRRCVRSLPLWRLLASPAACAEGRLPTPERCRPCNEAADGVPQGRRLTAVTAADQERSGSWPAWLVPSPLCAPEPRRLLRAGRHWQELQAGAGSARLGGQCRRRSGPSH